MSIQIIIDIQRHLSEIFNLNFTLIPTSDDGFQLNLYNEKLDTFEALMWFNQKGAICTNHKCVEGEDLVFYQDIWDMIQSRSERDSVIFGYDHTNSPLKYVNQYVFQLVNFEKV